MKLIDLWEVLCSTRAVWHGKDVLVETPGGESVEVLRVEERGDALRIFADLPEQTLETAREYIEEATDCVVVGGMLTDEVRALLLAPPVEPTHREMAEFWDELIDAMKEASAPPKPTPRPTAAPRPVRRRK